MGFTDGSFAQTIPVVTLRATEPDASSGAPGQFTVFRAGDATQTLNVYYRISGTASNGIDYATLGNYVQIPGGSYSNSITITPLTNAQAVIKTVTLTLAPSPLMPPVNYESGSPSNATVFMLASPLTNFAPYVQISMPRDGATFYSPANIPICANAFDPDGYVATVEFFAGTNSLGVRTNNPMSVGPQNPFCLIWSNVPPGSYVLTADATDNGGATTVSAPVNVTVQSGPPPTNFPPVVRIISPPNGATFHAPINIPLYAYAHDPDGSISSVEFFADTNSLGLGTPLAVPMYFCSNCPPFPDYVLVWSNAPLGTYSVTAVATDNDGATNVSPAVNLTILPSPPPPTNRPAIVRIVATDPIAIEGTNCWTWIGLTNPAPTWSAWGAPTAICRFFTNCGPKNASFSVRRLGETNDDLTVFYSIGGGATNGVDYVMLPGSVVIPAGQRSAEITVVPLDDGPPDLNSTVVLKLTSGTNYLVGFPQRAAATILESLWPRPVTGMLPGNCFQLATTGPDGAWFHIEYSTNMVSWTPVCTNQVVNGQIDFVDPDAPSSPLRFYRAVPEPAPPNF